MAAIPVHAQQTFASNGNLRTANTRAQADPFYQATPRTNPSGLNAAVTAMQQVSHFLHVTKRFMKRANHFT